MESIHLEVRGRVQGVGFRWYVMELARELRLAGWVKNRPDGHVEIAAAGDGAALAKLEAAVRAGSPGAHVDDVRQLSLIIPDSLRSPFAIAR